MALALHWVAVAAALILTGIPIIFLGIGVAFVGYRIRTADTDSVTDAVAGGSVNLEGRARPHEETLRAPFSGRECLGYEYRVRERVTDHDAGRWDLRATDEVVVPFLLENDGTVLVDPEEASIDIDDDWKAFDVAGGTEPPERIRKFVEGSDDLDSENRTLDLKILEVDHGNDREYVEYLLLPDETVFVSGVARSPADVDRRVPRGVDAVVGAPDPEGTLDRIRQEVWSPSFMISDAPRAEAGRRKFLEAAVLIASGLVFVVLPTLLLLTGG